MDGKSYTAQYDSVTGELVLEDSTSTPVWDYQLKSLFKFGDESEDVTGQVLAPKFGNFVRTEFDALGAGDYKFTILGDTEYGTPGGTFLEIQAFNFRKYMGVMPATTQVTVNGVQYTVTIEKGDRSDRFMTLTFEAPNGDTEDVSFKMAGVEGKDHVKMVATSGITPSGWRPDLCCGEITYNQATGQLEFDSTDSFNYDIRRFVNFQTVKASDDTEYAVDFVPSSSGRSR